MTTTNIIERFGGVTKEEPLSCVNNDILLKNTCVIEAVSPYFGYYTDKKHSVRPQMLYFVLNDYYSLEKLIRATANIQKKVNFHIDAVTGNIFIFNQTCYVIRILNIQNYSHIAMLQDMYIQEGIEFKKKKQSFKNEMGMIKLRRFFSLIPFGEGLYLEHQQANTGFFEIPKHIPWDDFKQITTEVKFDTDLQYFDAATAYIFVNKSITDMVRIYRENLSEEKLRAIKDKYYKLMK